MVAGTTPRSHGLGPRGEIVAGKRANVRGCGERGAWRPGSLCMAGVRGGALAMRNFSGFGLHGARKSVPNSPAWRLRLRKMRQLNQLPPPPTRPLRGYMYLSDTDTLGHMWVSGSDKQQGGKILGVVAFFRSEGNGQ